METGTAVTSLKLEHDRVSGVETSRGFISAEAVVIAGGAWSLLGAGDKALPQLRIKPVRGQMLCFQPSLPLARHVIYSPRGYVVPRRDGRLLAGSTSEHAGFEKQVTAAGVQQILAAALKISPRIASLPLTDAWPDCGRAPPILCLCSVLVLKLPGSTMPPAITVTASCWRQ